jgi:hypothetical protein
MTNAVRVEIVQRPPPSGDCNDDQDTDLSDFITFSGCLVGPTDPSDAGKLAQQCACVDMDYDDDVDARDFAEYRNAFAP